jgi:hypothetical protein
VKGSDPFALQHLAPAAPATVFLYALRVQLEGYSLHADVSVDADDRQGLERLLRYGARPPLAQSRLSLTKDGQVRYKLRKRYHDGRTSIVMSPEAFVRKLALLIPPPW